MSDNKLDMDYILEMSRLASEILNGKEFFISSVVDRIRSASEKHPHDQAITAMNKILTGRFNKQGSLATITQKEIQDIYSEVASLGKAEVFKDELGDLLQDSADYTVANYNEGFVAGLRGSGNPNDEIELVDKDDVAQFEQLFNNPNSKEVYASFINNGKKGVELELISMGFGNPSIEVGASSNEFIVYSAEIDTKNGRIPLLIPSEVKLGSVLLPSVFVFGNDFADFNAKNIDIYSKDAKTHRAVSSPNVVLEKLTKMSEQYSVISEPNEQANPGAFTLQFDGLYNRKLADDFESEVQVDEFKLAQVEMPEALKGISEDFVRETLVEAGLSYPRDTILAVKSMLSNELKGMGIYHSKIKIASEWPKGITLATTISGAGGNKTIEVPVEINDDNVLLPTTFLSGPVVKAFNQNNLVSFANAKDEGEFNSFFSDKSEMNFKELYKSALHNAAFGDFVEVEECLAVISDKFGADYHRLAFGDLMQLVRLGYNSESEDPINDIDNYIKESLAKSQFKENNIKMSNSLMYLYPEDDRNE